MISRVAGRTVYNHADVDVIAVPARNHEKLSSPVVSGVSLAEELRAQAASAVERLVKAIPLPCAQETIAAECALKAPEPPKLGQWLSVTAWKEWGWNNFFDWFVGPLDLDRFLEDKLHPNVVKLSEVLSGLIQESLDKGDALLLYKQYSRSSGANREFWKEIRADQRIRDALHGILLTFFYNTHNRIRDIDSQDQDREFLLDMVNEMVKAGAEHIELYVEAKAILGNEKREQYVAHLGSKLHPAMASEEASLAHFKKLGLMLMKGGFPNKEKDLHHVNRVIRAKVYKFLEDNAGLLLRAFVRRMHQDQAINRMLLDSMNGGDKEAKPVQVVQREYSRQSSFNERTERLVRAIGSFTFPNLSSLLFGLTALHHPIGKVVGENLAAQLKGRAVDDLVDGFINSALAVLCEGTFEVDARGREIFVPSATASRSDQKLVVSEKELKTERAALAKQVEDDLTARLGWAIPNLFFDRFDDLSQGVDKFLDQFVLGVVIKTVKQVVFNAYKMLFRLAWVILPTGAIYNWSVDKMVRPKAWEIIKDLYHPLHENLLLHFTDIMISRMAPEEKK